VGLNHQRRKNKDKRRGRKGENQKKTKRGIEGLKPSKRGLVVKQVLGMEKKKRGS